MGGPTWQQIEQFSTQGYVLFSGVFHDLEVQKMRNSFERLVEKASDLEGTVLYEGSQYVVEKSVLKRVVWCGASEPVLLAYGRDSRITGIAKNLLGSPTIDHLINQAHFKLPNDGVHYPLHQDSTHRRYGTDLWSDVNGKGSFVQTIIALDEATEMNGPLLVLPQSHLHGHLALPYEDGKETISDTFNPSDAIPVLMKPGDVVAFGPYLIHGSLPNTSNTPRRILVNGFAYPGANIRVYPGVGAGERI
jgi:ectoine hydroxylase-related dioxygenase (phytanoyl-CoA dioxygenase family)